MQGEEWDMSRLTVQRVRTAHASVAQGLLLPLRNGSVSHQFLALWVGLNTAGEGGGEGEARGRGERGERREGGEGGEGGERGGGGNWVGRALVVDGGLGKFKETFGVKEVVRADEWADKRTQRRVEEDR